MKIFSNKYLKGKLLFFLFLCVSVINTFSQSPKTWEWVRTLGSPRWDITGGAAVDAKNNIYITGIFADTLHCYKKNLASQGETDIFVARFTEKGNLDNIWTIGSTGDDRSSCLTVTLQGNIIIGGSITGAVTFDKITVGTQGRELFIAGMDKKGRFSFVTPLNYTGRASLNFLGTTTNEGIYACGQFTDTLTVADKTFTTKGKTDIFIVKISSTGDVEKLATFGGEGDDLPVSFTVSPSGAVTFAGSFTKNITIGKTLYIPLAGKKAHTFVSGLDTSLTETWGTSFNGDEYCKISSLKNAGDSALYMAGSFNSSVAFADTTLRSNGLIDGFIAKLSPNGKLIWAKNFGSKYYDYANNLNVDNLGGTIITGSIGDTLQLDSLTIEPPTGGNAAFVAQFGADGIATWGDYISGAGRNFGETALLDKKGNLYIYGSFTEKFEKESEAIASRGDQDIFLARYYNCPGSKAEVIGDLQFCPGSGSELKVKTGYKNVLWNDTLKSRFFYTNKPGTNWVSMYDKKGCLYTDTVAVKEVSLPKFTLGGDTTLFVTDSLLLHAPEIFTNYRWHDRSVSTIYLSTAPNEKPRKETCWLTVTDTLGCNFTDTINITYREPGELSPYSNITLNTWPNPARDVLNWSIDLEEPAKLVMDITGDNGKVLVTPETYVYQPGEIKQANISGLPLGTFYIRLRNTSGQVIKTQGFVKQ